jgi:prepilin-type N-terminal cleavage/methylation domain-containing protein
MPRRQGFTLVEILVAMALTIFLMLILTQCFVTSLQAFRDLKGAGDLEAGLRTAATVMRRDLAADHFDGKRRLSDPWLWTYAPNSTVRQGPPREGFFCLYQGSMPQNVQPDGYYEEGTDADGFFSRRALMNQPGPNYPVITPNQILHFTVKLRGNDQGSFFSAKVEGLPGVNSPLLTLGSPDSRFQLPKTAQTFNSPWAEVAYFLYQNGQSANGTPLFALYRRQKLLVPTQPAGMSKPGGSTSNSTAVGDALNWDPRPNMVIPASATVAYQNISHWVNPQGGPQGRLYFNSPADVTVPERRFGGYNITHYKPLGTGDDLLLNNVISFEVKVLFAVKGVPQGDFVNLYEPIVTQFGFPNRNTRFFANPAGPRALDTWSSIKDDTPPLPANYTTWNSGGPNAMPIFFAPNFQMSVAAISVTLRTWDLRTEQTRQITVVQDM